MTQGEAGMVFVSVGNATQPFLRLLEAVDALAGQGVFGADPVVMQIGHANGFTPYFGRSVAFLSMDEFIVHVRQACLVICHGGAGTLYHTFQAGKVPVVMPRRRTYAEHVDDQYELVKTLAAEGRVIPAYEPDELPQAIAEARRRSAQHVAPPPSRMLTLVEDAIRQLLH